MITTKSNKSPYFPVRHKTEAQKHCAQIDHSGTLIYLTQPLEEYTVLSHSVIYLAPVIINPLLQAKLKS
jgi:hypothetical protein